MQDGYCKSYYEDVLRATMIMYVIVAHSAVDNCLYSLPLAILCRYFASFVVLGIDVALEYAVVKFAEYEKHGSLDTLGLSVFYRLFILKFFNTGIVFLISVDTSQFLGSTTASPSIDNFSATWYLSVGVGVLLVQIGSVFTGHSSKVCYIIVIFLRLVYIDYVNVHIVYGLV